jgi:hypothetical protein
LETVALIPHPLHPPAAVRGVQACLLGVSAQRLRLCWRVDGAQDLVLPPAAGAERADGLWQTTCFEVFALRDDGDAYVEWNLSPSGRWNAYDFAACREGMTPRSLQQGPEISLRGDAGAGALEFDAALPLAGLPPLPCRLGISAVIEERGGIKSYWALAHASGSAPDFHARAGFTARLGPTTEAT